MNYQDPSLIQNDRAFNPTSHVASRILADAMFVAILLFWIVMPALFAGV